MMIPKLMFAGLLVIPLLPGCSSSDDSATPKQKCEDLIARFCGSAIGCEVSGGLLESSEQASAIASCKSDASEQVECSKAQGVSSTYDACMTKLGNPPCEAVNQAIMDGTLGLPTECEKVILVSG